MTVALLRPCFATEPTLTGDRVRLRPFTHGDHDAMWAMVNDEEGNRLTGTHATFTRAAVDRWYDSRGQDPDRLDLAIAALEDDACLGEVVLNDLDPDNASCAFRISLIGPQVFGCGYGSEAMRLILDHAFDDVGLHRVELEVYAFNTRAFHVYCQAGFVIEGVRRDALQWNGAFHDAVLMSVLAHEWRALDRNQPPRNPCLPSLPVECRTPRGAPSDHAPRSDASPADHA